MHNREKDAAEMAAKRQKFLETGYCLFKERGIERVSMNEVAQKSGIGVATLYRYFNTKQELVIAIGTWIWDEYSRNYISKMKSPEENGKSGKEEFAVFLDFFLDLYRNHRDLLRFNQFFNIYIETSGADGKQLAPYTEMIDTQADYFRRQWEKGINDHTLRSDMNWKQAFSACLHIILAAVTRYAVGLVYQSENEADIERELELLKEALLQRFSA